MPTARPVLLLLSVPVLCQAFLRPRVRFEDWVFPQLRSDTLHSSSTREYRYGEDPTFLPRDFSRFVLNGYQDDPGRRILRRQDDYREIFERDGSGRVEAIRLQRLAPDGAVLQESRKALTYDDQGRLVLAIRREEDGSTFSYTYAWNHPRCADPEVPTADGFRERVLWTVDDQGRCRIGEQQTRYGDEGSAWSRNFDLHLEWGPWGPIQRSEISRTGDTLQVHRLTFNDAGSPVADTTWAYDSTGASLVEMCRSTLDGIHLVERVCQRPSGFGMRTDTWSTRPTFGLGVVRPPCPVAVEVHRQKGRVTFHNPGRSALALRVSTLDGVLVADIVLVPGRSWSPTLGPGIHSWVVVSTDGRASGLLPGLR